MFQNFEPPAGGDRGAGRLVDLRAALARSGFDGMIVPRSDAHQGETVAPRDERLAWLTGFTGSAGLAAVLPERAALIVDGRYTLQAAGQVDPAAFAVVASHETPAADWIAAEAREGQVIGYDPWLHGKAEIARLSAGAERAGARLGPLKSNPIDRLWTDRPAPPMGAVRLHPETLAGESAADRRARIGAALTAAGADAAVLTLPDSIAWLLNIRGADLAHVPVALGFAVLHGSGAVDLYMHPDKIDGAVADALGPEVTIRDPERLGEGLDTLKEATVRLDRQSCALWIADRLERAGARIDWDEDPCLAPKARKTPAEIAGMRAAHLRDGVAMVRFLHWLDGEAEAGVEPDEIGLAERLEAFRRDTGCLNDIAFDTICGSGPNGAIVHYRVNRASNRRLASGEVLLVDSGGQYPDGTTDITRTVAFGAVEAAARTPFTLALGGMIGLARARWPVGLTGRDLDPLARAPLWSHGFDYDHGTGHGVGAALNVHEGPAGISRRSGTVALAPGMILSDEPGYYRAGAFGIRIENLLVVTEAAVPAGGDRAMLGFETLTLCPIDRRLIRPDVMAADEIAWLDAYHARVAAALGPKLDDAARGWLDAATAPIAAAPGLG